jgi:hypothetical protein
MSVKATKKGEQHINVVGNNKYDVPKDDNNANVADTNFTTDKYFGYDVGNVFHQSENEIKLEENQENKIGDTLILLDSQSTHSTFYVRRLVQNIRDAPRPLKMMTNGGTILYTQQADLPGYGTVWFNENSIANIISMLEAERKGHKKFYSPGCLSLTNVESGCKTDFKITTAGLYASKIPIEGVEMLQTVEENQQMFTPRQIAQAKQARELYEMVGRPSYNDFIAIIKNNLLLNSKITPRDVLHAEAIFGKDLGALQGKTKRKRPDRVITDYIHVPDDIMRYHNKVVLAIDVMTIAEMPFLITTSRDIQFTTIKKLSSKVAPMLAQGILKVANLYKRRGFFVDLCLGDNEFEGVRATLQNHGIKLNTCAPNEHVPEVERKIRTVKERV